MSSEKSIQQKLYFSAPYSIKKVLSSLYGLKQARERYGVYYKTWMTLLKESQWFDNDRLREFQLVRTKKFLIHARENTAYYNHLFKEKNFNPDKISSLDELRNLPLLKKSDIRKDTDSFLSGLNNRKNVRWAHTSGTTGQALVFPLSVEAFQREHAFRHLHYSWSGVNAGEKVAVCAGHPVTEINRNKPPFWTYDLYNKWLILSSYHLTRENLEYYIREISKYAPAIIKGYPSSIYLLALAHKHSSYKVSPRAVYTASETLLAYQRQVIEESFNCKVYNWYGTSEMCVNIVECEQGKMHLKMEHSYVEIIREDGSAAGAGEEGKVVCTSFGNYALPFIRYDVGDVVKLSREETCKCGRGGILVDEVLGRSEDYIITPDGRWVGRLDHIFKDSLAVSEAQIIQKTPDSIEIRMVISDDYDKKEEAEILEEARNRLGREIKIKINYVSEIKRTKNGKFKFIVSELDKRELYNDTV